MAPNPTMWYPSLRRNMPLISQMLFSRAYAIPSQFNVLDGVAEASQLAYITRYEPSGFAVNNVPVNSSIFCMGKFAAAWKPNTINEVTPESLAVFDVLDSLPEILILGCGAKSQRINPDLREFLKSKGIKLEQVPTRNAVGIYNLLTEEGRQVAAALLCYGAN